MVKRQSVVVFPLFFVSIIICLFCFCLNENILMFFFWMDLAQFGPSSFGPQHGKHRFNHSILWIITLFLESPLHSLLWNTFVLTKYCICCRICSHLSLDTRKSTRATSRKYTIDIIPFDSRQSSSSSINPLIMFSQNGDIEALFSLMDSEFTRSMWNFPWVHANLYEHCKKAGK